MTWQRKCRLVGWLALLAPLPLPFNEMAAWPAAFAYLAVVSIFLLRLRSGAGVELPSWVLNLTGALYFPVLFFDLASAQGGLVLRPLVHVAMFATAAKLFALRSERDKWHAVAGAFFLFLAGMGSSVHPALVVHLIAFTSLLVFALVEFAEAHNRSSFPRAEAVPNKKRFVGWVITGSILGCAVIFPLFPRLGQPQIAGGGGADLGPGGIAAFGDDLTLDAIGSIRGDRSVALQLAFQGMVPGEIRLKGMTYDVYNEGTWSRARPARFLRAENGTFVLASQVPLGEVEVLSRLTGSRVVPVLLEVSSLETGSQRIGVSDGGDLQPFRWGGAPLRYSMEFGRRRRSLANEPPSQVTLNTEGVTDRIRDHASSFFADSESALDAQIAALERHFVEDFSYSLDVNLDRQRPIEDFLFEKRTGHCEYFASAMVLMLRSQGIAARVVGGFLGAEANSLEDFYVVRNSNAHAWVEAYVPGRGWLTFDPTPPAGRPIGAPSSSGWRQRLADAYDWLIYRWDRYVLTYSSADQSGFFARLVNSLKERWRELFGGEPIGEPSSEVALSDEPIDVSGSTSVVAETTGRPWWWLAAVAVLVVALSFWALMRKRGATATALYLRLRSKASTGVEDASQGPLEVAGRVVERVPQHSAEVEALVSAYLQESFGGRELERDELSELRSKLADVLRDLPKAA